SHVEQRHPILHRLQREADKNQAYSEDPHALLRRMIRKPFLGNLESFELTPPITIYSFTARTSTPSRPASRFSQLGGIEIHATQLAWDSDSGKVPRMRG